MKWFWKNKKQEVECAEYFKLFVSTMIINAGDVVLISTKKRLTNEAIEYIRKSVAAALDTDKTKVLIFEDGFTLSIIKKQEAGA